MLTCAAAGVFLWMHWPGTDYATLAAARDQRAQDARGDIVIAAVTDARRSDYVSGIELAVHQLNCEGAEPPHQPVPGCRTLLGRRVTLRIEQASDEPGADMDLVDRIVHDDRVVAVLGHRSSQVALPASRVYEAARVIFMSPFATRKNLTGHDFRYVMRMAPGNAVMAGQLASLAATLSHDRVAILHSRDEYSRELGFLFEEAALARGIRISRRSSFVAADEDYRGLISELRTQPLDAVFLSAPTESAARMIRQLRELGVLVPVIGTDIDPEELRQAAGPAGERTLLPVLYRASQPGWRNAGFVRAFQARHGRLPDVHAAQGYDSMLLLASAIQAVNTTRTTAVASALHFMPFWIGVTGLHAFDPHGELFGKHYQFQWLHDGTWQELPGLHWRFQLEQAEQNARRAGRPLAVSAAMLRDDTPADQVLQLQFDLARHMLQWARLGVIVALGEADSPDQVLPSLSPFTAGSPAPCIVRAATLDADLAGCLPRLAADADALMLARFDHLGAIDRQAVQARLRRVNRPVFALGRLGNGTMPPGLSLYIDSAATQADFALGQQLIERLAPREGVDAARQRLANLPRVQADLQALLDLGLQKNAVLLDLHVQELPPAPPHEHPASLVARVRAAAAATSAAPMH